MFSQHLAQSQRNLKKENNISDRINSSMENSSFSKEFITKICAEILDNLHSNSIKMDSNLLKNVSTSLVEALEEERENNLKKEIIDIAKNLQEKGFFPGTSGNISVRLNERELLITPAGINKGGIKTSQIIKTNLKGDKTSGEGNPSSEIKMHLSIYCKRPDAGAIVHAHPSFATGFAAAGLSLDQQVLPEAILVLGRIPLVEYGTPSTWELPNALEKYLPGNNAFLLANHGALTLGKNLIEASHRMETLEVFAKVILIARILGGEKLLTPEQLKKLANLKEFPSTV